MTFPSQNIWELILFGADENVNRGGWAARLRFGNAFRCLHQVERLHYWYLRCWKWIVHRLCLQLFYPMIGHQNLRWLESDRLDAIYPELGIKLYLELYNQILHVNIPQWLMVPTMPRRMSHWDKENVESTAAREIIYLGPCSDFDHHSRICCICPVDLRAYGVSIDKRCCGTCTGGREAFILCQLRQSQGLGSCRRTGEVWVRREHERSSSSFITACGSNVCTRECTQHGCDVRTKTTDSSRDWKTCAVSQSSAGWSS